jgi:glycosyltransferase involved in cell wall biosynthesis
MEPTKKPKLLIALSRFPFPVVDGTRHKILHNVSDALLADFELEYFVVTFSTVSEAEFQKLEGEYGKVHLFRMSRWQFLLNAARGLLNGLPFQTAGFYLPRAARWFCEYSGEYSAFYAHTVRMAACFTALPTPVRSRVLMDFNDAISLNYSGAKYRSRFPMNIVYRIEESRIRTYECALLSMFKHYNVISAYDKEYLLALNPEIHLSDANFACIPYGVPSTPTSTSASAKSAVYFIGQLDYEMNREAVLFFLDTIWGPLKQAVPEVVFYVIGKTKSSAFDAYRSWDGVKFTGFVPDVFAVIQDCTCLVAPIRSGAGMPTKIIEALSYGMPVVTTPLGVRGVVGAVSGVNMLVVDENDLNAWVKAIVSLTTDQQLRSEISKKARTLFDEQYELSRVQSLWRKLYLNIVR